MTSASDPGAMTPFCGKKLKILAAVVLVTDTNLSGDILLQNTPYFFKNSIAVVAELLLQSCGAHNSSLVKIPLDLLSFFYFFVPLPFNLHQGGASLFVMRKATELSGEKQAQKLKV